MDYETEGPIIYIPQIRSFKDTGYVKHQFTNGQSIMARVEPSADLGGYAIELVVKDDSGHTVCDFSLDRFSALCLVDVLVKNLLNQEELVSLKEFEVKGDIND